MERIEIQVTKRDSNGNPKGLRRNGQLPGIVYGAGGGDVAVALELRQFERSGLSRAGSHIVRFASADAKLDGDMAIIREVQVNPLSGHAIHVDFLRIDMTKPVDAFVPLAFVGKPAGVVNGGILQPLRRELEVRALPDRLPNTIEVDVSALEIGDSIHVADLKLAEGVEALDIQDNFTLVTVVPPAVEEAPTAAAVAVEGAPAAGAATAEGTAAAGADAKKAGGDAKKAGGEAKKE